jgi:hypothetical protein
LTSDERANAERQPGYDPPQFKKDGFSCPHCGRWAHQEWWHLTALTGPSNYSMLGDWVARCARCQQDSYWIDHLGVQRMVYPSMPGGPPAHDEMPEAAKVDYDEARDIVGRSPRGACALLRLAVQKLATELSKKKDLNEAIAVLVAQGLSVEVQQALDSLRVIGNNAVHPGEMDLKDDHATATALFECMNLIVEQRIAQPKRIAALYERLPESAREQIERRDASGEKT